VKDKIRWKKYNKDIKVQVSNKMMFNQGAKDCSIKILQLPICRGFIFFSQLLPVGLGSYHSGFSYIRQYSLPIETRRLPIQNQEL
jgi:hypothetical protein